MNRHGAEAHVVLLMQMMFVTRNALSFLEFYFENRFATLMSKIDEQASKSQFDVVEGIIRDHDDFCQSIRDVLGDLFQKVLSSPLITDY